MTREFRTGQEIAADGGSVTPTESGTITVCHRQNANIDTYGGRNRNGGTLRHMNNTEPPAPGWLGNPYPMDEDKKNDPEERRRVVAAFLPDFFDRIGENEEFRAAVEGLRGQRVACWCHGPSTDVTVENFCHLDAVRCYLDGDMAPVFAYLRGAEFDLSPPINPD